LSSTVVGWNGAPLASYLAGLMVSQGGLLLVALVALRQITTALQPATRRTLATVLIGLGLAWTWSALVG
jgi:urease accessory protein